MWVLPDFKGDLPEFQSWMQHWLYININTHSKYEVHSLNIDEMASFWSSDNKFQKTEILYNLDNILLTTRWRRRRH